MPPVISREMPDFSRTRSGLPKIRHPRGMIIMAKENQNTPEVQASAPAQKARREFVKTSAQVAVTAPAVAVLLSGMSTPAHAISEYEASQYHILDDYTTGNNREDIDAIALHSNTNPNTGKPQQDDTWPPPIT